MTLTSLIIGVVCCVYFASGESNEILRYPEGEVVVLYKKRPFMAPCIELRKFNGKILASKVVSKGVTAKDVETHVTENGIVILPGDSDWVWRRTLWGK